MNNSSSKKEIHIGILGAMPEEIGYAISDLDDIEKKEFGDLVIYSGKWKGQSDLNIPIYISVAWSGWGKVSAARASTRLINTIYRNKKIDLIIFTGVAGAINPNLNQWDVIIPNLLIQHDMDATPIYAKYVIPALNKKYIQPKKEIYDWIFTVLEGINTKNNLPFQKTMKGLVATGDQFISDENSLRNIRKSIEGILAVEMEGAAVAQVCEQENIPWVVIRVISDGADGTASLNFKEFITAYEKFAWSLVKHILGSISTKFTDLL